MNPTLLDLEKQLDKVRYQLLCNIDAPDDELTLTFDIFKGELRILEVMIKELRDEETI